MGLDMADVIQGNQVLYNVDITCQKETNVSVLNVWKHTSITSSNQYLSIEPQDNMKGNNHINITTTTRANHSWPGT